MALWVLIRDMWRHRQRRYDLQILWPICKKEARDMDHAKAAFAYHAFNDPAWLCLGEEQLIAAIERLR